ncbi:UDP-N-acetylmuramyl tripeptide synthetase [Candidatus Arthromitus sp. SFB-mouse-Yit]|nr:UDP-N-acetylmuramyl tripeptide synthetase [Candidatus Arthromitus sp. SFB-mouse-Yit]
MLPGITTTYIKNYNLFNKKVSKTAIIEVDEASLKYICKFIEPKIIAVTNIFRDQLDRYGEVYTTLNHIKEGIKLCSNSKLILNGDEPLLCSLEKIYNSKYYFGFENYKSNSNQENLNVEATNCKFCGSPYEYNFITYNHLGNFKCSRCDFKREELDFSVADILENNINESIIKIKNNVITINQGGIHNIYNVLCAYAISSVCNIPDYIIIDSIKTFSNVFGRQENFKIKNNDITMFLVKNPAGFNETLNTINLNKQNEFYLGFLLNDNFADGQDISWIYDVNIEMINDFKLKEVFTGGTRTHDMGLRLNLGEVKNINIFEKYEEILDYLENKENETVYILCSYTCMLEFRRFLYSKKYIDSIW